MVYFYLEVWRCLSSGSKRKNSRISNSPERNSVQNTIYDREGESGQLLFLDVMRGLVTKSTASLWIHTTTWIEANQDSILDKNVRYWRYSSTGPYKSVNSSISRKNFSTSKIKLEDLFVCEDLSCLPVMKSMQRQEVRTIYWLTCNVQQHLKSAKDARSELVLGGVYRMPVHADKYIVAPQSAV